MDCNFVGFGAAQLDSSSLPNVRVQDQGMCLLSHSTEKSPSWEAKLFPASQEIPRILWNP